MNAHRRFAPALLLFLVFLGAQSAPPPAPPPAASQPATSPARVVRVAVIGGMYESGFWDALAQRFEKTTGIRVEPVATGPKNGIAPVFKQGGIDLITMHASDTMINLVADGWAADPQPWAKNDMIIVGPSDDPAGIAGAGGAPSADAVAVLRKIAQRKSPFVVHAGLGAHQVLRDLLSAGDITLDPDNTTNLLEDQQRRVLKIAADKHAYTLVGRIAFRSGKIPNGGLVVVCEGDERLKRPYVLAVADPIKVPDAHVNEARRLAAFMRSDETQAWIAEFGRGKFDDRPLFFPVAQRSHFGGATTQPSSILKVYGQVNQPLELDAAAIARLPRHELHVKDHDGSEVKYTGVFARDVLKLAGLPIGTRRMRGLNLSLYLVVEAEDGYRAVFALAELDDDFAERSILLADTRNDGPLAPNEGRLRLVAPGEGMQARWVRKVRAFRIESAGE